MRAKQSVSLSLSLSLFNLASYTQEGKFGTQSMAFFRGQSSIHAYTEFRGLRMGSSLLLALSM
jgi:hypothetical protein